MGYKKYFTMTYDDGVEQDKRFIKMLNKYGLRCTFNINSGLLGNQDDIIRRKDRSYAVVKKTSLYPRLIFKRTEHHKIPEDELKQVYEGFEVASHGVSHQMMSGLDTEMQKIEIINDMAALEKIFGYPMKGHVFPHGDYVDNAKEVLLECGVKYTRSIQNTGQFFMPKDRFFFHPTCDQGDIRVMDLLDKFINVEPVDQDLVFMMWGHSYEMDYGTERNNWEQMERICDKISGHDDIVYCTNWELLEMTKHKE